MIGICTIETVYTIWWCQASVLRRWMAGNKTEIHAPPVYQLD
jgi:hypothetical protein